MTAHDTMIVRRVDPMGHGPSGARAGHHDPVRRLVLTALALWLAPAFVAALLIGAIGLLVVAVVKVAGSRIGAINTPRMQRGEVGSGMLSGMHRQAIRTHACRSTPRNHGRNPD